MSEKPVAERLQVKSNRTIAVEGASAEQDKAVGVRDRRAALADADVLLFFARDLAALNKRLNVVLKGARFDAIIWVAYPKLASALAKDLSREVVRDAAFAKKLDTVGQIAFDQDWSAMRLKRL